MERGEDVVEGSCEFVRRGDDGELAGLCSFDCGGRRRSWSYA